MVQTRSETPFGSVAVAIPDDCAGDRHGGLPPTLAALLADAAAALERGDNAAAARALSGASAGAANHPEALRLHGMLLTRAGRAREAVAVLRHVVQVRPRDTLAHDNLAEALTAAGDRAAAVATWRQACERRPDSFAAWFLLGANLDRGGGVAAARAALERAVALAPDVAAARMTLGDLLALSGDSERAAAEYRAAVARQPELGEAWCGLSNIAGLRFGDGELAQMELVARRADLPEQSHAALEFALAKAYEDADRHEAAFDALRRANARMQRLRPWNARAFSSHVDEVLAAFAEPVARAEDAALGHGVIFIVGVPRSGSTLTEQILASHPLVEGGDELPDLLAVLSDESARRRAPFPRWVALATADDWQRLGQAYLARTRVGRNGKPYFTDKQPNNWLLVGAALAMLPGARVIDCRRDPLETCWSCYRQVLPESAAFSYDFADLAAFFCAHARAAQLWSSRFPGAVREQVYEALVADPQGQTRALLDFCGLPFDAACLEPHRTERIVRTTSATQVREPIRRPVSRAERYGTLLDPLRAALQTAWRPADAQSR